MKRSSGGNFKPNFNRFAKFRSNSKAQPLAATNSGMLAFDEENEKYKEYDEVFTTKVDVGCPYQAWKLYFPDKVFSQSTKISVKTQAVMKHFKRFIHWYDTEKVLTTFAMELKVENFVEDEDFENEWPTWYEDLTNEPFESFSLIGLAMHTVIQDDIKKRNPNIQLKKIFIRPVGWRPLTDIIEVFNTKNTLISTVGVVKKIEPIKVVYRFLSYKCRLCPTELFVRQNPNITTLTRPSKCVGGCKARGGFEPTMSSPFSIVAPTQMISIQEICYETEQRNRSLEVQLNEEQVDTVFVGSQVVVTGVLKYRVDKTTKNDGTSYVPYVEGISVFNQTGPGAAMYRSVEKKKMPEIVPILKGDPNLFKILINSLCPVVYGREEAKAALLLALFSGFDLLKSRRSNSHILLLGNPGTAKSTLMIAAASASPRGMLITGGIATQAGMTACVSSMGTIEAGALILSDNGVCCIDEIDKMKNPYAILLEPMEQQCISLSKCGAVSSIPARCSVIAAANPIDNVYDETKPIIHNINFLPQLISRFDLIVPFLDNMDVSNHDLPNYMDRMSNSMMIDCEFFKNTQASTSSSWLRQARDEKMETIPLPALKSYIEYAQQNINPRLTFEAAEIIKAFFIEFTDIFRGNDQMNMQGPARIIESVMRLTLARARAELLTEATAEHANEIIELFKYTQIDIYERKESAIDIPKPKNDSSLFGVIKRKQKTENVSTMSKPKQMKAFMEFLSNKCDEEERDEFSRAELKEFSTELGIKEFDDIIFRLNNEGLILQTVNGYKIVSF